MGHATARQSGADGQLHDVLGVGRAHDPAIVDRHVHEQLVELHVLLGMGVDQVVELQAGDRQHRLAVQLGVIEAVQEVDAPRPRGGDADPQPAGPFGVGAGHEGRRLFVPGLDEADLVLAPPQRFDHPVHPVAGDAEHRVHAPVQEALHHHVAGGRGHGKLARLKRAQAVSCSGRRKLGGGRLLNRRSSRTFPWRRPPRGRPLQRACRVQPCPAWRIARWPTPSSGRACRSMTSPTTSWRT